MDEPAFRLFVGDPYRCELALRAREATLCADDPNVERSVSFGDEVDPGSLQLELTSLSLFSLARHVVVRRADKARSPKGLAGLLRIPFAEGTYSTWTAEELRPTSPIAKEAQARGALVSLPAPRGSAVRTHAKQILSDCGVALAEPALRELIARTGGDLLAISREAEKLRTLSASGPLDAGAIERTVYPAVERTVYPFYDRLGEGDLGAALAELGELRDDPGRILGGILRHLTRLSMIRLLLDQPGDRTDIAAAVGVQEWLLRRLIGQAKRRSLGDLCAALRRGLDLDRQIKSGLVAPSDALLLLVLAAAVGPRAAAGERRPTPRPSRRPAPG